MKIRIISGFLDTRTNKEDFALTPYLSCFGYNGDFVSAYGISLCWGWYSILLGIGFNLPESYPTFMVKSFTKKTPQQ